MWGGYAYGRGLDGREARDDMEQSFRRIAVAAKNQDTREHDIMDSDDYFQYHGGMVATVRALTGRTPAAYVGDSAVTDAVKTRTLAEETKRVFRARVVNPKWITAMQRHGYKGAFELAATVDYLFGYDATAGVVDDWMYTQLAESYVFDETNRAFMERSNPWALRGITERLLEAEGFALVLLDCAAPGLAAPDASWKRLARAASSSSAALLLLSLTRAAGSAAEVALEMRALQARFTGTPPLLECLEAEACVLRRRTGPTGERARLQLRTWSG